MKNLTKRQSEIFNYIKEEIEINGYPPTRSEISKTFGFRSPNAAEDHLKALKKKGVLDLAAGTSRGITLLSQSSGIPVVGLVNAGGPILAEENIEKTIPNSPGILSHGIDFYLKVKGDSMIDVGIFENDLIAINKNIPVKKGSIVVARINDEVTVKTLTKISDNLVILRPENPSYSDIEINPKKDHLVFEGTCVGLLRDFS
tara:strand:- start:19147 stop:19749 length:603 start_codon:yes stop_codon:yes gene_type:complete